jgi:hypothetical protein
MGPFLLPPTYIQPIGNLFCPYYVNIKRGRYTGQSRIGNAKRSFKTGSNTKKRSYKVGGKINFIKNEKNHGNLHFSNQINFF